MKKEELVQKLEDIEWEDFEVKEAKSEIPKNSWETVSAFSNTSGGWLVFGVKKEGKEYAVVGVSNPEKVQQDFITILRGQKFNQKIAPVCRKYNLEGKTILAFYIPVSERKPIFYDNPKNTFIRTGSGDQRATQEETNSLFRDSTFGTKDREITKLKINDLNEESIKRYRIYLKNIKPEHQYNSLSDEEFLTKIRVLENRNITLAGLLVFGSEDSIAKYFADFKVDYLEIFGTSYSDALNRYEFRMSDYPNLFEYFFAIYERIIKKIDIPFKLNGAFRDENQPQVKAIREALVNLLIHSDYFSPMKPRIRVFSNRIEFFNPGALPKPYEELRKGDISLPRNPLVTKIFRVIDLAENGGYGFEKMFKGWRHYYSKDPVVTTGLDYYGIEFFFERDNVPDKRRESIIDTIKEYPKITKKELGVKLGERLGVKLGENEIEILKEMIENKFITSVELAKKIGISTTAIDNNISKLKEKGLIRRVGPDKGGSWEVLNG